MAKKKASELTMADLGKSTVIEEPDGDRNSGRITIIGYAEHRKGQVNLWVGGTSLYVDSERELEITD